MKMLFMRPIWNGAARVAVLMVIGGVVNAADMPTDADIRARMQKQASATADALSRVQREVPVAGSVRIDVPKAEITPQQAKTDNLQDVIRKFNGGKPPAGKKVSDLMVFVSLSMPKNTLTELSRQAKEAGAVLILRGLKDGSWSKTMAEAKEVNKALAEWEIHPQLFKQFKIDAVPAIVLADASKIDPEEDGCAPEVAYTSVVGDISIEQALDIMRMRAKPEFARMAEVRLDVLKGKR